MAAVASGDGTETLPLICRNEIPRCRSLPPTIRVVIDRGQPLSGDNSMRRWFPLILLSLFLTIPAPSDFAAGMRDDRAVPPDFTLPTKSGTVSLRDFRGNVVFVDFWASWCMPCRQSFPWMSSMSDRYSAQGLVIVAI